MRTVDEREIIARLRQGITGPDGIPVRADAGDISHIALRKPEFAGRLQWVLNAVERAAAIWEDAGALPDRPRVLYDWTAADEWGGAWRIMVVTKPTADGMRKLVTAMVPVSGYWRNHAKQVMWRASDD